MKINIVLPFSRMYALERVFNTLEDLKHPEGTSVLITCDIPQSDFIQARNVFSALEGYDSILVMHNRPKNKFNREIREDESFLRRERIAEIHNIAKENLNDGDYVFLMEDDGDMPPDTLMKLLKTAKEKPDFGAISGVEVSRHARCFNGLWKTDSIVRPKKIWSLMDNESDEIDGAGMYALLLPQEFYGKHRFKSYGGVLGPDYNLVNDIRKQGYKCYVNWNARVPHLVKDKPVDDSTIWRATLTRGIHAWTWRYEQQ